MSYEPAAMGAPILLVEDDAQDAQIARRAFAHGNISNPLYVVRDGHDAMDFLRGRGRHAFPAAAPRPALILLDLNMPGMDGRAVLSAVKRDPQLRCIPVVVLTTSDDAADVRACYEAGANTYITKPLEFRNFVEVVATVGRYWMRTAQLPATTPEEERSSR